MNDWPPHRNAPSPHAEGKLSKPRIFIGSSVEGLSVAEHLQLGLEHHAECTIWHQGVFGLSGATIESLSQATHDFDFAILVLSPDDLLHKRGAIQNSPRDNVLFELGLFMGALGRNSTFIVYCRDEKLAIPTDLAGITPATYPKRSDNNLQAALGPVCTQIKMAISRKLAVSEVALAQEPLSANLASELGALKAELTTQTEYVRKMLGSLTAKPASLDASLNYLLSLEGIWKELGSNSIACVKVINGMPRFVYAYGGYDIVTGEYYNWRAIDGALLARFKWFDNSFSGFSYLERIDDDHLKGGWWLAEDMPAHLAEPIPGSDGMVQTEWVRQDKSMKTPDWAKEFFASESKIFNRLKKK